MGHNIWNTSGRFKKYLENSILHEQGFKFLDPEQFWAFYDVEECLHC
jgi:hypothetical protein